MRSSVLYVPNCYGKRYHNLCVIILCKQIPQLMIISKWTTEFNYIFGSMWNKNYFFHTIIFLNDVKRPWGCWWVNPYVNSNFRSLGFKNFQKWASRSTIFFCRTGKSWVETGCFNFCRYSVSFVLDIVKLLRASMSILAGMFETLFNSYCSVCLSEGFFLAFAA